MMVQGSNEERSMRKFFASGMLCAMAAQAASGAYVLTPLVGGGSAANVLPGSSFVVDLVLTSGAGDLHNAAVFQVEFSEPGLIYTGYEWQAPYLNGTLDDFSTPLASDLPQALTASTFNNPLRPGVVDVDLQNVLPAGPDFGVGLLVRLFLTVPADYAGAPEIEIRAVPDLLSLGFEDVPTSAGPALSIFVPGPGTLMVSSGIMVAGLRRRRGVA
jgi:hypothetical protein